MSELSTREVLVRARKLIEDPERWAQRAWGYDAAGNRLNIDELGKACRLCVGGALLLAADGRWVSDVPAFGLVEDIASEGTRLSCFNDSHSHAEVLAVLDTAIAACEDPS
jgi:hypothetical protein